MKPLIISAAITGGGPRKSAVHPVTPGDVLRSALEAWRAGASILHLHAREDDGASTMQLSVYRRMVNELRAAGCDAIINVSSGDNGGRASHEERLAVCDVGADMVSLGAGSFNAGERLYDNSPSFSNALAQHIAAVNAVPEIEIFDTGQLHGLAALLAKNLIPSHAWVNLVFGSKGGMPANLNLLQVLVGSLPLGVEWSVTVQNSTPTEFLRLATYAFLHGGHVRTGLEDHVQIRPDEVAQSNAELVQVWITVAGALGRPVATPALARQMLQLRAREAIPTKTVRAPATSSV